MAGKTASGDSGHPDIESLTAEIDDRLAVTNLTPAGQLRVPAKVLLSSGESWYP
jgi:hypothetical protein